MQRCDPAGRALLRTLGVVDDVESVDLFLQLFEGGGDGLLVEPAEQGLVEALVFTTAIAPSAVSPDATWEATA